MILLSEIPLPDNKKEKVWIFDTWVNQMGDFCTWGAMKEADSGCGLAESSAWAREPCLMINWTKSLICTKVFCGKGIIYVLGKGQHTLGDIQFDLFVVS